MPSFTSEPPEDPRGVALRLVRTPTHASFKGLITCDNLIGTATHFWHGRTVPHEEEDCKACLDQLPWRWHAWISVWEKKTSEHLLFEMTAVPAKKVAFFRKNNNTLRGAEIEAWRPSKRPNGRVSVIIKPFDVGDLRLPAEPDVLRALAIIWNIALVDVDVAGLLRDMPRVKVNDRNAEVFNPSAGDRRKNGHAKK